MSKAPLRSKRIKNEQFAVPAFQRMPSSLFKLKAGCPHFECQHIEVKSAASYFEADNIRMAVRRWFHPSDSCPAKQRREHYMPEWCSFMCNMNNGDLTLECGIMMETLLKQSDICVVTSSRITNIWHGRSLLSYLKENKTSTDFKTENQDLIISWWDERFIYTWFRVCANYITFIGPIITSLGVKILKLSKKKKHILFKRHMNKYCKCFFLQQPYEEHKLSHSGYVLWEKCLYIFFNEMVNFQH